MHSTAILTERNTKRESIMFSFSPTTTKQNETKQASKQTANTTTKTQTTQTKKAFELAGIDTI